MISGLQSAEQQEPIKVFFHSLDVDDPAARDPQTGTPNLADADFDVHPLKVEDNRGIPKGGVIADPSALVPAGAVHAETHLDVSLQPGDNYRVGASTAAVWLDDLRAFQPSDRGEVRRSDGAVLSEGESDAISEMLTVWRTLHLEVDSMASPPGSATDPQRNFLQGKVTSIGEVKMVQGVGRRPTRVTLSPDPTNPAVVVADGSPDLSTGDGNGRFERGRIRLGSGDDAVETANLLGNGDTYVETRSGGMSLPFELVGGSERLSGLILEWDAQEKEFVIDTPVGRPVYDGGVLTMAGVQWTVEKARGPRITVTEDQPLAFHLVDDDAAPYPFASTSTLLTDCQGDAECEADAALNVFAQAYVRVKYDLPSAGKTPPFVRNVEGDEAAWASQLMQGRDISTMSRSAFWAGYVQGAFQETTFFEDEDGSVGDGDPDTELVGGTPVGATPYLSDDLGSLIFTESLRDYVASPVARILCPDIGSYPAKVVAHEVGHQFKLQHPEGAILAQGCNVPRYFSASSLGVIRSRGLE